MMSLMPVFGEQTIPVRIRLAVALGFCLIVTPALGRTIGPMPPDIMTFLPILAPEVVTGLFFGLLLRFFVFAIQTAGSIAAQSTSLSQIFGGTAGADPQPAMAHVLLTAGLALAALMGLHVEMARYILTTYEMVPVGTLFECLLLWGYANGYATLVTFQDNPVWFVALILLIPIWSGFHFYWYHRLFHVEPLYKWFHYWHHKNVNTGPWSGHAMHPIEHVGLYSDLLIYFLVASHPVHVIFNAMHHTIAGPTSHCGFENVTFPGGVRIKLGSFYHQLHHRFIDCNYGSEETPWDRVFGSFHDGTPEGDQYINQRRRAMMERRRARTGV